MTDISNKTLAILVGIAIVVSVVGILSTPQGSVRFIGAAVGQNTTSGIANVSIQTVVQINLVNRTVDFGAGFVNGTDVACILESNRSVRMNSTNGTETAGSVPCANASGGFGFNAPARDANFMIENVGNTNITLTVNGSYATARQFLCDPLNINQNCTQYAAEYTWQSANFEANTCSSGGQAAGWTKNLTTAIQTVCSNMNFSSNSNSIQVAIRLQIPRDSRQGLLTDNVTFTGTN